MITAPAFALSNKLINILTDYCKFTPKFSIKNSQQLVNKIDKCIIPNNAKLVSFDVQNLFPSIPPSDVLILVENLLTKNNVNCIIKQDILESLLVCCDQNYFEFNGNIYISKEGLIMGNPLSPILAEIFMDNLEHKIHEHPLSKNFIYWYRYVDDILACFIGTDRQLNSFLNYINNLHQNIKFTIEIEQDHSINFLDLTISIKNNKHDFKIFHKPSYTDITIHNTSNHPFSHKISAYNSFVHRLINTPMSEENYNLELNLIKQIAVNNGYDAQIIDKIVKKKQYKKAINLIYPTQKAYTENTFFQTLTYTGKITTNIGKFCKKRGIHIAYRTNNTLGKYIKNNKSKTDKLYKSGVYQLNCGSCPKIYIGQTGRSFKKRINEHKYSFNKFKLNSNYAKHLLEENHAFDENFKILNLENKNKKLNFLESMQINKFKNQDILLNDHLDLNDSPLLNLH